MPYEAVIGLEIHAELNTRTKMFCSSLNDPDEKHPNINICPVCMGHPGTLPSINRDAVAKVIATGLALNGAIDEFSQFDRKNYFYPDLPKGYQISQYEHPLVRGGHLDIAAETGTRRVRITRIHLEEDTGRLTHDRRNGVSLVDFNRAGVPLMELVTEADIRTGEEVRAFGEALQQIVRYVGASDANMEKGQMRVEVNISLRPAGQKKFGTKVEIKNINSFKYAADAVAYEIRRQTDLLERGGKVAQETRGWDEHTGVSVPQRSKEQAHDYRYFPEPDLPPLRLTADFVDAIRRTIPELPAVRRARIIAEYGLEPDMTDTLIRDRELAAYFEAAASEARRHAADTGADARAAKDPVKTLAGLITGDLVRIMREKTASAEYLRITPENMGELAAYAAAGKISNLAAKQILAEMFASGGDPSDIVERMGLWQISSEADIESIARHIVAENPKAVEDWRRGKTASAQFLVGQIMKESRGATDPSVARETVLAILKSMTP
jgi:aspartyl-tRNA(Asn)/glutamyl-tRNA(Gln) amidotransferase subunit B